MRRMALDHDVVARLKRVARQLKRPLDRVVNDALRAGLPALEAPSPARQPFRTDGFDLGASVRESLDSIEDVLTYREGSDHR